MIEPLIDQYLNDERQHCAQRLGIDPGEFKAEACVLLAQPGGEHIIQIVRIGDDHAVVAAPEWQTAVQALLESSDWKSWLGAPAGLDRFVRALGLENVDTTFRAGGPSHGVGLLCNNELFRPFERLSERVVRVTPEHPLWSSTEWWDPNDRPPERPFKYAIVENEKVVAEATVRRNLQVLGGRTCALGVYVRPTHRRKGYGKAVVSAATKELLGMGQLVLWHTQVANLASLGLCESLGYKRVLWDLAIPRQAVPTQGMCSERP